MLIVIILLIILTSIVLTLILLKKCKFQQVDSDKFIFEIDDFLTDSECDNYINNNKNNIKRSTVLNSEKTIDSVRTSSDITLIDSKLDKKILDLVNKYSKIPLNLKHGELSTLINYKTSQEYKHHYDICHPTQCDPSHTKDCIDDYNKLGSLRNISVIIYLNDDFSGGETNFSKLNLNIKPKKGKALLFYNCKNDINTKSGLCNVLNESEHAGTPIESGEKWIIVKWYRIKEII